MFRTCPAKIMLELHSDSVRRLAAFDLRSGIRVHGRLVFVREDHLVHREVEPHFAQH